MTEPLAKLLLAAFLCFSTVVNQPKHRGGDAFDFQNWEQSQHTIEMKHLVMGPRSSNSAEREMAKHAILELSRTSNDSRRRVISELIAMAKIQNGCIEGLETRRRLHEWKAVTEILGEMKAIEAIDVLVDSMHCMTGVTLSIDAYPAAKAIISLGQQAVPKLTEALGDKRSTVRYVAVRTLVEIGGLEARKALVEALHNEKDKRIAQLIRTFLKDSVRSSRAASPVIRNLKIT